MRIIGGRDYYDGAVTFDTDATRIFIRHDHNKTEPQKIDIFDELSYSLRGRPSSNVYFGNGYLDSFYPLTIIFCGKIYNFVYYYKHNPLQSYKYRSNNPDSYIEKFFWNREDFLKGLDADGYLIPQKSYGIESKKVLTHQTLDEFFEVKDAPPHILNYLIENKIIVAIRRSVNDKYYNSFGRWFINTDALKEYHFGSVVNQWTANQEIDMFLGTILVKDEDNRIQLSDASKAKKHGFDKLSFRNQRHRGKPRGKVAG